jgi:hypothetical protein
LTTIYTDMIKHAKTHQNTIVRGDHIVVVILNNLTTFLRVNFNCNLQSATAMQTPILKHP